MTVQHPNFYENIKEANMRLRGTVVLYDGQPYYVFAITNHKPDGIFRIYLDPIGWDPKKLHLVAPGHDNYPHDHPALGEFIDKWMESNPKSGLLRKHMNSPHFNKYRPYPLGMCNVGTQTYYIERQPNRKSEQGLIRSMLQSTVVTTGSRSSMPRIERGVVETWSKEFKACVLAEHPSPEDCLAALLDPTIENDSVAFDRHFALVRGPVEMIFLAYKADIIGVLPNNDLKKVRLGRNFLHTKEVVEGLNLFNDIM